MLHSRISFFLIFWIPRRESSVTQQSVQESLVDVCRSVLEKPSRSAYDERGRNPTLILQRNRHHFRVKAYWNIVPLLRLKSLLVTSGFLGLQLSKGAVIRVLYHKRIPDSVVNSDWSSAHGQQRSDERLTTEKLFSK